MDCPGCARSNRPGARFCGGCGASLAPRCPACGGANDRDARFCDACGGALAAPGTEKAIARKVVTVVFADLIGSVSLHERLDAESARRVVDRYHRAMTAAVELHGGRVVQLLGDGVLAAFGVPRVAEDDAIRAVRAAAGMQRAFRELAREQGEAMATVGLRVAVNTGEVVVSDDETAVMGDPTNVAARLQQEARDGDVLVGEATQRLVGELVTLAPLGSFALRGRSESVAAFRLVSLERPASARATAFVGRDEELRRLLSVYEAAVAAPGARLALLLGSPGLGKSRLVAELARRAGERATVLAARCDAAGGATFAPIADALRGLLRIEVGTGGDGLRAAIDAVVPGEDAERARIAAGIGALLSGAPSSPEETFFSVRRLLAALATVRPVVLAIDDLHWGEPLLLDLVEHLVQWSAGVPLFLLVAARPELRDARSSLATPGPLVAEVVTLGGLDASASMQLAAGVVGAAELPAALVGRVLATSEGNPLFLAELVRMLVQDGTLAREGERWVTTVEVAKLEMPPTIQVLLAARIERLRPDDRVLLERAAVIGRHFSRSAVAELLGGAADLDARLESLRRSELVEPDSGWFLGEPALRFHHVLIRDAAYRRVLKETRAELHERFADWVVAHAGEAGEHDETIGRHLEQAHQNLRELGAIDARGRTLGERAARHLGAAGRRALARDDLALAASLLGRAIERLEPDDPARADVALDWCEALLAAGEVGAAVGAVAELGRLAAGSERLGAWHACFAGQLAALTDPQSLRATAGEVARAAAALADAGDVAGEAKAHAVHAGALARLGEIGACETALDQALAAARRARDRRRSNAVLAGAPVAALWGPSPVARASGRCLDVVRVLRITLGAPAVESVALRCQAVLETLRGRGDAARRMIAASRAMVEELGIAQQLLECDAFAGLIELLEDDAEAAETPLRSAYEGLRARGLAIDAARAAALLGRALLGQGRAAEAEALSIESEALGGDDLKAAIAWRGVRAEALAQRGETDAAVELARAAVALASATDALLDHADARLALATALRAASHGAEAAAEEARAIELWDAKGATLLAGRMRPPGDSAAPDANSARDALARGSRRRIRPNAATESGARVNAAIAARDVDALLAALAADAVEIHHATGAVVDLPQARRDYQHLLAPDIYEGVRVATEPLATLGERLALARADISFAGVRFGETLSTGATDMSSILLLEAGPDGLRTRTEFFPTDQLAAAIARLYERLAELEPEGAARESAARRARVVAGILARAEPEPLEEFAAPDVEFADRRVLGLPGWRGIERLRQALPALQAVAEDLAVRVEDVLALTRDAFVLRSVLTGIDRGEGGRFEHPMLQIRCFAADGRMIRTEFFEPDREAAALARFEELTREDAPPVRRIRLNAATANAARVDAAAAARDLDAFLAALAPDAIAIHHPTGAVLALAEARIGYERLLAPDTEGLRFATEPLASLGERLALARSHLSFTGARLDGTMSIGAAETSAIVLLEVGADGLRTRTEFFATDRLGDAIARLYERHAERLPEGPERERAVATARAAASDLAIEVHDVLALHERGFLVARTTRGPQRDDGGGLAKRSLMLRSFGPDGLARDVEWFDPGDADSALARFETLARDAASTRRRVGANAATACAEAFVAAVAADDLDAVAARIAEPSQTIHHPSGAVWGSEGALASWRMLMEGRDPHYGLDPVATLGDAMGLFLQSTRAGGPAIDDAGDYQLDHWLLLEADAAGRMAHAELFATDHLADAVARLYAREAERLPEGPEREAAATRGRVLATVFSAFQHGDLEDLATRDVVLADHRVLGLGFAQGIEAMHAWRRSFAELSDELVLRVDAVLALDRDGLLLRATQSGVDRASGGRFERPSLQIRCFATDGRLARTEWFDADCEAQALARYDALARGEAQPEATPATRSEDAMIEAWRRHDWDAARACFAPGFRSSDRRSLMHLETGAADLETWLRPFFEMRVARDSRLLATRGDRLALYHMCLTGSDELAGPSEVELLQVIEVDEAGRRVAAVAFDVGDLAAAHAELDARHAAGEAAGFERTTAAMAAFSDALARRDWDALAACCAPDLVVADHRRLGWEPVHGPAAYVAALRALVELAPDTRMRLDHVETAEGAFLVRTRWEGTRDGGAFEEPSWMVGALDADGRMRRLDQYEDERADAARARFAEIGAATPAIPSLEERHSHRFDLARTDPSSVPPNAAARAMDRFGEAAVARDWDAFEALLAPAFAFEDRRHGIGMAGDRATMLRSIRLVASANVQWSGELLATSGDRLALTRNRFWTADGRTLLSEIETLQVAEVDEQGRLLAHVVFDPEDRRAAAIEMFERSFAGGLGCDTPPEQIEFTRALLAHDRARMRAALAGDFRFSDHRTTGLGPGGGAEEYVAWLAAAMEESDDLAVETLCHVAIAEHGTLGVGRAFGTLRGGGTFESVVVRINRHELGRWVGVEVFALEDLERAKARFAELGAAPPRNAAWRIWERIAPLVAARDWDALRALAAPGFAFEDRRRRSLVRGDVELYVRNLEFVRSWPDRHVERSLVAMAGDRLAVDHLAFTGDPEGGAFEGEFLRLTEVGGDGLLHAVVHFDGEDGDAAQADLRARAARIAGAHGP